MNTVLTKNEYYVKNKQAFTGLSALEKKKRYQAYLARKSAMMRSPTKNQIYALPRGQTRTTLVRQGNNINKIKNKNQGPQSRPSPTKLTISECTLTYAQACIDPFDVTIKDACIPDNLCAPSCKYRTKVEGTMTIGTQGVGYVVLNPWAMAVNNTSGTFDAAVIATNATYDELTYTNDLIDVGTKTQAYSSNSPFQIGSFNESETMRVVGAGIEIEYIGQLLNQSGAITVFQNDGLSDLPNNMNPSTIRRNNRARTCANSKDNRCYITYNSTSQQYNSYEHLSTYLPGLGLYPLDRNYPLIIIVSGATPGITFNFTAVAHLEAQIGIGTITPSEADPIGYPAFQQARSVLVPTPDPRSDLGTVIRQTLRNIASSISGMGGSIGTALGTVFGQPVVGGALGSAAGSLLSSLLGN